MSDTEERGEVETACRDSEAVFHMLAGSEGLQPLSALRESGRVGMAPANSASLPSQPCLRFPFFLLEEAEHLPMKVTALIPTACSRVYGWPLLVTQGSACTAPCLPLSDCKGAGAG